MQSKIWAAIAASAALCAACGDSGYPRGRTNHANSKPVVEAGTDLVADVGQVVELQGSAEDANGDPLTYTWSFVSLPVGSAASILGADTLVPNFIPDVEGVYLLRFSVSDGGAGGADEISVVAFHHPPPVTNLAPCPVSGFDRTAAINGQFAMNASAVMLDGSGSWDPDGDVIVRYLWTITAKPLGSTAILNDPELAQPSLLLDKPGQYRAVLQVYDGELWSPEGSSVIVDAAPASYVGIVGGDGQTAQVGTTLPEPLQVLVENEFGDPVEGIAVRFGIAAGDGGDFLTYGFDHTEPDGVAFDTWTLGTVTGPRTAQADVILHVDNFGNTTEVAAGVWNATALSGPAVDFVIEAPDEVSVDAGAIVSVSGRDLYGNPAADDFTTQLTLNATGAGRFAASASVGTVLSGGGTGSVVVQLDGGNAEILLDDNRAEAVAVSHVSQSYSAEEGPFLVPPPFTGDPVDLVYFAFPGTPLPVGDGTLTLFGRGDFGGGFGMTIADSDTLELIASVFESAPHCSPVAVPETLPLALPALIDLTADGEAGFLAANLSGFDPFGCAENDFTAALSFSGSADGQLVRFHAGAPARVVLMNPDDVEAGSTMLLSAFSADQFGNPVIGDSTTRFSIRIGPSSAVFGTEATDGVLVAGGGTEVHLRVTNGLASIEVFDTEREAVEFQLGDPFPASTDASMSQVGNFIGSADSVILVSGDGQSGTVGQPLAEPLVFEVRDDLGFAVPNAVIFVSTTLNDGFPVEDFVFTGPDGRASVSYVLGTATGENSGVATAFGSVDATFSATGVSSSPTFVRLRMGTPAAAGSDVATVVMEVLDGAKNVVSTDDSTTFSVYLEGDAVWSSMVAGTEVAGLGSPVALVKVQAGVAELEITDPVDEAIQVIHADSTGNGLIYIVDGGPFVAYESDFEADDGGLSAVALLGVSSWEHGTPATQPAFSGTQAWATSLAGNYNAGELSCLELRLRIPEAGAVSSQVFYQLGGIDVFEMRECDDTLTVCSLFASRLGTNGVFEEMAFDLSQHAGQFRRLQWCLDSHTAPGDGILVDDVKVTGTSPDLFVAFTGGVL